MATAYTNLTLDQLMGRHYTGWLITLFRHDECLRINLNFKAFNVVLRPPCAAVYFDGFGEFTDSAPTPNGGF
jgi:hypothetical protein